jgi:hypothetical protein
MNLLLDKVQEKGIINIIQDYIYEIKRGELYNFIDGENDYKKINFDKIIFLTKKDKGKVKWNYIILKQKLSDDFIRKYKHKADWKYIKQFMTNSYNSYCLHYKDL